MDTGKLLHEAYGPSASVGAIFSPRVADYLASRPDYPSALFEKLESVGAFRAGATLADLGAGTGLLTCGLLRHGCRVFAIEPNPAMRAAADRDLGHGDGYQSLEGSAEAIPLADHCVDMVTAAQAFHWFEIEAARRECLRVLKPGGKVVLIWNDRVLEDPLHVALDGVFAAFGGSQRAALAAHEERRDVQRFFGNAATETWKWPHEQTLGEQGILSLVFSRSYMPPRETEAGAKIEKEVKQIFADFAVAAHVTVRYQTLAIMGELAP